MFHHLPAAPAELFPAIRGNKALRSVFMVCFLIGSSVLFSFANAGLREAWTAKLQALRLRLQEVVTVAYRCFDSVAADKTHNHTRQQSHARKESPL